MKSLSNAENHTDQDERRTRTSEELARARRARNSATKDEALKRVVELNIGVAHALASRYARRGVPLDDLQQVAGYALTNAARHFDPKRSDDFLAYAVPTVRGELRKYFRDCAWTVRPPRNIQERQPQIAAARSELEQEGHLRPTAEQIAAVIGESVESVRDAELAEGCFTPLSLDAPHGADSRPRGEFLADDESEFDCAEARAMLEPALRTLGPREQTIIRLRFFEELTQREIGERIGVSQMQVSRLIRGILEKLRGEIGSTEVSSSMPRVA
jgi:RNA polymerase sigma-B factor